MNWKYLTFELILVILFTSCKLEKKNSEKTNKEIKSVVCIRTEHDIQEFLSLKLDTIYKNLLHPKYYDDEQWNDIKKSWADLHRRISKYVESRDFKWEVPDSTIKVSNKLYFDKNGDIEYYRFKVLNDKVTDKKLEEYEMLLTEFCKNESLNLKRNDKFAQCGNIKYYCQQ